MSAAWPLRSVVPTTTPPGVPLRPRTDMRWPSGRGGLFWPERVLMAGWAELPRATTSVLSSGRGPRSLMSVATVLSHSGGRLRQARISGDGPSPSLMVTKGTPAWTRRRAKSAGRGRCGRSAPRVFETAVDIERGLGLFGGDEVVSLAVIRVKAADGVAGGGVVVAADFIDKLFEVGAAAKGPR